jgi:hypothetical protein
MKVARVLGLLMVVVLLANPLTALAQEEPQWKEFVSTDGKLTLTYPDGWFLVENGIDVGLPGVQISNSETALTGSGSLKQGEVGIVVILLPQEILPLLGIELPAEGEQMTPENLVKAIASVFIDATESGGVEADQTATPSGPQLSEPTLVDLTEELEAGYMTLKGEDGDGVVIAYQQDGVIVLVVGASAAGSYTEEFDAATLAVAGSVQYSGTSAELFQFMMGGSGTVNGAGESVQEPTLESGVEVTVEPVIEPTATPAHRAGSDSHQKRQQKSAPGSTGGMCSTR